MRAPSGDQFSGVKHVLDPIQELSGLLCSQAFTIEGIQNLLDQSIRDFGGQIRHWERLPVVWIGGVPHNDHRLIRLQLRACLLVNDQRDAA